MIAQIRQLFGLAEFEELDRSVRDLRHRKQDHPHGVEPLVLRNSCDQAADRPERNDRQIKRALIDEVLFALEQGIDDVQRPDRRNDEEEAAPVGIKVIAPTGGPGFRQLTRRDHGRGEIHQSRRQGNPDKEKEGPLRCVVPPIKHPPVEHQHAEGVDEPHSVDSVSLPATAGLDHFADLAQNARDAETDHDRYQHRDVIEGIVHGSEVGGRRSVICGCSRYFKYLSNQATVWSIRSLWFSGLMKRWPSPG